MWSRSYWLGAPPSLGRGLAGVRMRPRRGPPRRRTVRVGIGRMDPPHRPRDAQGARTRILHAAGGVLAERGSEAATAPGIAAAPAAVSSADDGVSGGVRGRGPGDAWPPFVKAPGTHTAQEPCGRALRGGRTPERAGPDSRTTSRDALCAGDALRPPRRPCAPAGCRTSTHCRSPTPHGQFRACPGSRGGHGCGRGSDVGVSLTRFDQTPRSVRLLHGHRPLIPPVERRSGSGQVSPAQGVTPSGFSRRGITPRSAKALTSWGVPGPIVPGCPLPQDRDTRARP